MQCEETDQNLAELSNEVQRLRGAIASHKEKTLKRTPKELHKKPGGWAMWSLSEIEKSEWGYATSCDYALWGVIDG